MEMHHHCRWGLLYKNECMNQEEWKAYSSQAGERTDGGYNLAGVTLK